MIWDIYTYTCLHFKSDKQFWPILADLMCFQLRKFCARFDYAFKDLCCSYWMGTYCLLPSVIWYKFATNLAIAMSEGTYFTRRCYAFSGCYDICLASVTYRLRRVCGSRTATLVPQNVQQPRGFYANPMATSPFNAHRNVIAGFTIS